MNTLIKYTLALTLSFLSSNVCISQEKEEKKEKSNWSYNQNTIKGNGNTTTKNVKTQPYDFVEVVGSMNVQLQKGSEGNIQITTDENLHEYISVESNGTTLKINIKDNTSLNSKKGIVVLVPFETLSNISLVGSGIITSKETIKTEAFSTEITGSGEIKLTVMATTVDSKVNGSGTLNLSGTSQQFEIKISGSGGFEGSTLVADEAEVYVSGSGNAIVNAKNTLKIRVNGSGSVQYKGSPEKKDTKVMGSGSVKAL